jgi:hypothetical protein
VEESPKSRARKHITGVLSPRDTNIPLLVNTAKQSPSNSSSEAATSDALKKQQHSSEEQSETQFPLSADLYQPSMDAAKLFVSKLKYKDLQQELKVISCFISDHYKPERIHSIVLIPC